MFEYGLYKNHLTPDPDDYAAKVQNLKVADEEAILKEMVVPGGVTETQATAVFTARRAAIKKLLAAGMGVRTDFVDIKPAVRGIFINYDDVFDDSRHIVVFNAISREELLEIARDMKPTKVRVSKRVPLPERFVDTATQRRDEVISTGKVGEIKGSYLKCDETDNDQGVFIIKPDGSELRCASFIHNTASRLLFYIPEGLTAGENINLEVRNKLNNEIKAVRSGYLAKPLNVL